MAEIVTPTDKLRRIFNVPVWVKDEDVDAFTTAWAKANLKTKAQVEAFISDAITRQLREDLGPKGHITNLLPE